MPRLKSLLADEGTSFANHFLSISLCCPSRVAILRGQYAHNTHIFGNGPPDGGFQVFHDEGGERSTVATWLKAAGYRTALMGKYLNGYPSGAPDDWVPPGFSEWQSPNGGDPYSEFDYTLNENGFAVSYGHAAGEYMVDVLARKAERFIRETTALTPRPSFFLMLTPYVPHQPATAAPRYAGLFSSERAPRTPAFNEADVSDKPSWLRHRPLLDAAQIDAIDQLYRNRLRSMLAVEDLVQTVLDALRDTGQLDHTYVFFTSDNGFHQGQHRLPSGKNTEFDEDLFAPLVVRGPGVPRGATVTHLTVNIDFAPTLAELASVPVPDEVDGRSLAPLLGGNPPPPSAWRHAFLLEHAAPLVTPELATSLAGTLEPPDAFDLLAPGGPTPAFVGVRTVDHTYVEYRDGDRELYDDRSDPDQLENGYASADSALVRQLAARVAALRDCRGAACRAAEDRADDDR
jgi:arylsulfatase A-like enzyme